MRRKKTRVEHDASRRSKTRSSSRTSERPPHKQVEIAWQYRREEVDEELAPLLLELWKNEIETCNSCQENRPGIAWIEFPGAHDAKRFLDLVAEYPGEENNVHLVKETLYGRLAGYGSDGDWEYNVLPYNWSVEPASEVIEYCMDSANFGFFVSIRFPRTDLPLILKQIRKARLGRRR